MSVRRIAIARPPAKEIGLDPPQRGSGVLGLVERGRDVSPQPIELSEMPRLDEYLRHPTPPDQDRPDDLDREVGLVVAEAIK